MAKEIERKFLVKNMDWKRESTGQYYHQAYLSSVPERVVRLRVVDDKAFLTIKGINKGSVRDEYEYPIPKAEAEEIILNLCEKPSIEKYRYLVTYAGYLWEIDEFLGENNGLVVAEIELKAEDEKFELPKWVGEEVTDDPKYFNSNLIRNPYSTWGK